MKFTKTKTATADVQKGDETEAARDEKASSQSKELSTRRRY